MNNILNVTEKIYIDETPGSLIACHFNVIHLCMVSFAGEAPPPGAYDPKFDNKVKGLVIEKSDRFLDTKSQCSAECSASVASTKSNGTTTSTPLFRTVRTIANFVAY